MHGRAAHVVRLREVPRRGRDSYALEVYESVADLVLADA
jgi:hypothetical protein